MPRFSYYIVPGYINESVEEKASDIFEATIINSFLYDGPIIISDSVLVNSLPVRNAVRKSEKLQKLFQYKFVKIANRYDKLGNPKKLTAIANDLKIKNNGTGVHWQFKKGGSKRFEDFEELHFLDGNAQKIEYQLGNASLYYTNTILDIFQKVDLSHRMRSEYQEAICLLLEDYMARNGGLLEAKYLEKKDHAIGIDINRYFGGKDVWQEVGPEMVLISYAAYASFIPEYYGANPIFDRAMLDAIDLWRKRSTKGKRLLGDPVKLRTRVSLNEYVNGILSLKLDQVYRLINCDECKYYRSQLFSKNLNELEVKELQKAYIQYTYRIEEEILKALKVTSPMEHELRIQTFFVPENKSLKLSQNAIKQDVNDFLLMQVAGLANSIVPFTSPILGFGKFAKSIFRKISYESQKYVEDTESSLLKLKAIEKLNDSKEIHVDLMNYLKRFYGDEEVDTMIGRVS